MASVTDAQFLVDVVEKTYDEWRLIHRCTARGSNFGADIPFYSYLNNATGCASRTIPQDACNTVQKPRNVSGCDSYYAFVPRGNCQFSVKAYRVQLANYDALIVYSNPGDSPISMDGSKYKDLVKIPVVMVDYNCMERIMKSYPPEDGYQLEVRVIFGYYNLVKYLIPFVCVVVLCFIVLFMSLLFRIIRERRRDARKRLSKKNLKKLPLKKFKKGDSVETCAICLDDFIEGEKLRILPCNHVYHCKCVDPWLTKNRKVCPICKRKILFSGDSDSSDSENERSNTAGTSGTNIHENAPLIANEFIGVSSSAPRYLDDGPIYTGNSTDNPDFNADEPTTSSSIMSSTPVDRHFTIDLNADGFLNSTTGSESLVGTNSCSLPGVIRKKFHPFLHNLVNKAVRTIRKDQGSVSEVPQVDADGLQCVGNFSAENEAFDDGSETHDVSNVQKIDDENNDDMNAVCTSPVAVVGGTDFNDGSIYFSANEQSFPLDQSNDGETEKTLTDVSSNVLL